MLAMFKVRMSIIDNNNAHTEPPKEKNKKNFIWDIYLVILIYFLLSFSLLPLHLNGALIQLYNRMRHSFNPKLTKLTGKIPLSPHRHTRTQNNSSNNNKKKWVILLICLCCFSSDMIEIQNGQPSNGFLLNFNCICYIRLSEYFVWIKWSKNVNDRHTQMRKRHSANIK